MFPLLPFNRCRNWKEILPAMAMAAQWRFIYLPPSSVSDGAVGWAAFRGPCGHWKGYVCVCVRGGGSSSVNPPLPLQSPLAAAWWIQFWPLLWCQRTTTSATSRPQLSSAPHQRDDAVYSCVLFLVVHTGQRFKKKKTKKLLPKQIPTVDFFIFFVLTLFVHTSHFFWLTHTCTHMQPAAAGGYDKLWTSLPLFRNTTSPPTPASPCHISRR